MRVLIIDDDDDLRTLLEHFIKEQWPDAFVQQFDPLEEEMPGDGFPFDSFDAIVEIQGTKAGCKVDGFSRKSSGESYPETGAYSGGYLVVNN